MTKYQPPCSTSEDAEVDSCGDAVPKTAVLSDYAQDTTESTLNRAFQDHFILVFDTPCVLKPLASKGGRRQCPYVTQDKVQFNIAGAGIPSVTVPSKSAAYSGHTLKVSSHSKESFVPLKIDFLIDKKWDNYWVLWKWLDVMSDEEHGFFDQKSNASTGVPREYMTLMSLIVLDSYKRPVGQFDFHHCFITSLDAIQFNYQQTGEIGCGASFEYSRFNFTLL